MASKAHLTTRVRQVLAVALLGAALWAGWTHRHEIHRGLDRLDHPIWEWLVAACAVQGASMVIFARLQRWLLRCGGVRVRLRDMVEITLAGNALSTSLPGGAAWAAGWIWGQLRRRSVERVLASWVVLVAGALSSFALFLMVAAGAELAGAEGPVASLRWVTRSLLFLALLLAAAVVALARSESLQRRWAARVAADRERPGLPARAIRGVDRLGREVRIVTPSPAAWAEALLLALANWGADLATLVFCIWTVHASVPWRGIVVAYALTQISASIPITPGGLAVVEASLATLLVAYGMSSTTAVTVVVLYRLISFWVLVPIGWAAWGLLEMTQRRSETRHHPWAVHRHPPVPAAPKVAADMAAEVPADVAAEVAVRRGGEDRGRAAPDGTEPPLAPGAGGSPTTTPPTDGPVPAAVTPAFPGATPATVASPGSTGAGPAPAAGPASGVAASPERLEPGAPQGPERLLGTSECDGCDEVTPGVPALTGTPATRPSSDGSGAAGGLEHPGQLG